MSAAATVAARDAGPGLLAEVGRFCRFSVLGFSLLLPLAGAATVSTEVSGAQIAALLLVAIAFHVAGYVTNDVFDLRLDRTEPLRAGAPLVRGLVSPRVALSIGLVPVPLAAVLHLLAGGAPAAAVVLLSGMGLGLAYNAFGKRISVPFVSDGIQALAWIALALYGALAIGGALTVPFIWLSVTVFLYVLMVNGLHGGLRDLANDARHGARTTAILLGARVGEDGRVVVPSRVAAYGLALHVLLLIAGVLAVAGRSLLAAAGVVAAHLALLALARSAFRAGNHTVMVRAGFAHLFFSIGVVLLPFAVFGNAMTASTMLAVYGAPVLVLGLRMRARHALAGFLLIAASIANADSVRLVTRQELVEAMTAQKSQGYNLLATTNGVRFNSGVLLHLAREAVQRGSTTPLLIDHADYFEAYLTVTGVARDKAPAFIRIANDFHEDQLLDFRPDRVIEKIVRGPRPKLAINVVAGWTGGAPRYSYVDMVSEPPLRVTHERTTSHRILDFGDCVLIADIHGIYGRALGGLLGLIFKVLGDAEAVQSYLAIAGDGVMVTLTTGRKGPFVPPPTTATVWPDGRAEKGLPDKRPDLVAIERRLKQKFEAKYLPQAFKSPR